MSALLFNCLNSSFSLTEYLTVLLGGSPVLVIFLFALSVLIIALFKSSNAFLTFSVITAGFIFCAGV